MWTNELVYETFKALLLGWQKARSIEAEMVGDISEGAKRFLYSDSWVYGPKGDKMVEALGKIIDRLDNGGEATGQELFNVLFIVERNAPQVMIALALYQQPIIEKSDITQATKIFRKP